jgi:glycosyltransferase involved in cell wall biosynthesis
MRPKLLFVFSDDRFFWSHRLAVAQAALSNGYEVIVATGVYSHAEQIRDQGFRLIPLKLTRKTDSLLKELGAVRQLRQIYRTEQPDIVHHVAIKAVLYGSMAALGKTSVPTLNALTGLGYLAASSTTKAALLRSVVWNAFSFFFKRSHQLVLVENEEDKQLLVTKLRVSSQRIVVTRGSGVNVDIFQPSPEPSGVPVVLLASRMLWIKGIQEFAGAAQLLRSKGVSARFVLAGDSDVNNPSCVPRQQLFDWQASGILECWGHQQDMPGVFKHANLVCLPSHGGEGVPKVLMEAAASGRAIITTTVPGCRDIVRDGVNGLLVEPKNAVVLADAIEKLLNDPALRLQMGHRGRQVAVTEFSEDVVVRETLELYSRLLGSAAPVQVAVH